MRNQGDIYYEAVLSRDYRFDGKFFTGVKTTGIFCRPICPAKPKRENVEFFPSALSAEKAGYRPCLRCRPESAPQSPAWIGKSATVQRALKLIANNALLEQNEDFFAEQLGVSARHLRRLFEDELGRTPKQISDANRLNFSRKLITETTLPITEIAFTSGFSSIRRFNDAFKERFHRAPSELRRGIAPDDSTLHLSLSYRPPFDWDSLIQFFQAHQIDGVESAHGNSYERVFELDGSLGAFRLSPDLKKSALLLQVATAETRSLFKIVQNVRLMFDLDSDPLLISNAFSSCRVLAGLVTKYPGLRLPRGWSPFEIAICSILGQLVSVEQARGLVRQLVKCYGKPVKNPLNRKSATLFPTAKTLSTDSLSKLGTTQARKNTIREFSKLVMSNKINLDSTQDPIKFREKLLSIKGIGPWTAEYISLRAIGDTDAFPGTDLILKRVLDQNSSMDINSFRPWRAYCAIYLWKEFAKSLSKTKGKSK